jgi:predicted MPP superfamily phosphohydrolase
MDAEQVGMIVVASGCALVGGLGALGALALLLHRFGVRRAGRFELRVWSSAVAALAVGVGCFLFGIWVEPDWIEVTHTEVTTSKLRAGERVRIVHLSDLHVDRASKALRALPAVIAELAPDFVVFTGDALNDAASLPLFREALTSSPARRGRIAVRGNHDTAYWSTLDLFGGGVATELVREPVVVDEGRIAFCGAPYDAPERIAECLRATTSPLRIVAYHTPDLVEQLAPLKPDLYLAGHTHGGQVRVPFYGAVVTLSDFGKFPPSRSLQSQGPRQLNASGFAPLAGMRAAATTLAPPRSSSAAASASSRGPRRACAFCVARRLAWWIWSAPARDDGCKRKSRVAPALAALSGSRRLRPS